ncbi:MAG: hypothetical protein MUE34_07525 [Acidimicrobiales bacterium]|nr:hypothetical protein [Acidimicrobiales bacterium]
MWTLSSAGAAALVGGALGLLAQLLGVPPTSSAVAAMLVTAAALADLGHITPPSIRRQVPQVWGRILDPHVTAVLYGARLGIGPATMLSTWLWWAATAIGASLGAGPAALVGVVFATSRTIVHVVVAARVDRLPRWQERQRAVTRALELAAVLVATTVLLAGCSGDDTPSAGTTTSAAPTATTVAPDAGGSVPTTTEVPVPETTPGERLAALLPPDLAGYEPITDRPGADTTLDLDAAAAIEQDAAAERSLLETRGFVAGATRAWRDAADHVVVATVYEFATPEDAALYLQDGFITLEGFAAAPFDVPDTPGARGFTQDGPDGYRSHGVAFVRGSRWFLVFVDGPPETTTIDEARRLAALVDPGA